MCSDESSDLLIRLVHRIRTPAGEDPRFASLEQIKANMTEFIKAAHKGMTDLHIEAVSNIMMVQDEVKDLDESDQETQSLLMYKLLWYHVNNNLAWMALKGERHVVRRLCGFKPRPILSQSNPDAVMNIIAHINEDPMKFAMWSDATSFIDAGDILVSYPASGTHHLLEVKQQGDESWAFGIGASKEQVKDFQNRFEGDSKDALKKTERLRKQLSRMRKITKVVQDDVGTDPFLNVPVVITESDVTEEHYHQNISHLMKDAQGKGWALDLIDDCLWVGVYYNHDPRLRAAFAAGAAGALSHQSDFDFRDIADTARAETELYTQRASHPLALPVFMFELSDEEVMHLITGIAKVRMFFHWESWGRILEPLGGSFRWLSHREYRETPEFAQVKNPDRLTKGIPYVTFGDQSFMPASTHVVRVFTDMLRPSSLAAMTKHQANVLANPESFLPGNLGANDREKE